VLGVVMHVCNTSYAGAEVEELQSGTDLHKNRGAYPKNKPKTKGRALGNFNPLSSILNSMAF
jgi:hypothetical protein